MKFKFSIFLLSLLALNNIQSAGLSEEEITKRQKAAEPYKVKEVNKTGNEQEDYVAQAQADIELTENLPDVLKKIVGQLAYEFTPEEIEKANKQFDEAETKEQMVKAMDSGAFWGSDSLNEKLYNIVVDKLFTVLVQPLTSLKQAQNNLEKKETQIDLEKMRVLLDYGADPNFYTNSVKDYRPQHSILSELMWRASYARKLIFPILEILLNYGADIDKPLNAPNTLHSLPAGIPKTFREYLNAGGSEGLLKLYNDYISQKAKKEGAEKK